MTVDVPEVEPDVDIAPRSERQPPYAVILHNDDVNGFGFVVNVLRKVFGYTLEKSVELTTEAHEKGRSVVWSGALELAELKADQIHSCGGDPQAKASKPLGVTVEPLA